MPAPVLTAAAQPELAEDLRAALSAALAQRGALGEGTAVQLRVLSFDTAVQATRDAAQIHQARLVVQLQTAGPLPRQVVLQAARSYPVQAGQPLAAAAARADAAGALAEELAQDAVEWLMFSEAP